MNAAFQSWVQMLLSFIQGIAWPLVVGLALVLFRGKLGDLIENIEEVTSPVGSAKVNRKLRKAADAAAASRPEPRKTPSAPEPFAKAMDLLAVDPGAAVAYAWTHFSTMAEGHLKNTEQTPERDPFSGARLVADLYKCHLVTRDESNFLNLVRTIRNTAVHVPGAEIDPSTAEKAVRTLFDIIDRMEYL
ncbi:MAG: hypothetical protein QM691_07760 [Opitutaceae bacterium]